MSEPLSLQTMSSLPEELRKVKELVYDKCGFDYRNFQLSSESKEYAACSFELNRKTIQQRTAKITPTKTGQFVSIWKRDKEGITVPFDTSDQLDFMIITVRSADNFGQFIFPKSALVNNAVMSSNGKGGKRGMRVYPPWDVVNNKQAEKSQCWQMKYFLTIKPDQPVDVDRAKKLLAEI